MHRNNQYTNSETDSWQSSENNASIPSREQEGNNISLGSWSVSNNAELPNNYELSDDQCSMANSLTGESFVAHQDRNAVAQTHIRDTYVQTDPTVPYPCTDLSPVYSPGVQHEGLTCNGVETQSVQVTEGEPTIDLNMVGHTTAFYIREVQRRALLFAIESRL